MLRTTRLAVLLSLVLAGVQAGGIAHAAGGGGIEAPTGMVDAPMTPEEIAVEDYNAGVGLVKDAEAALAEMSKSSEPKKQQKQQERARKYFTKAQKKFESAIESQLDMYQAWNYLGYCKRNLGDYKGALDAYDQALQLNPRYFEAIEYRGHAYLGLNRIGDAKESYLDLFAGSRPLADKLLLAMQAWIAAHRNDAQGVDPAAIDDFAKWVAERGEIATRTAGLSPDSGTVRWR